MSDPARVYARKYADLEAERDRYREALEAILAVPSTEPRGEGINRVSLIHSMREAHEIARPALEGPNGAPREEGS